MAFSDDIAAALDLWFSTDIGAVAVTYTPDVGEGTPVSIYGHVEYGAGEHGGHGAILDVRVSDVANPQYGDDVVIGSVAWRVARPGGRADFEGDGHSWRLPLVRDQRKNPLSR